jgi:4-O-beta-D-mannosyl-D-glucose phosphorylase
LTETSAGEERRDVSNVVFATGGRPANGDLLIYYASSDTRQYETPSPPSRRCFDMRKIPPGRVAPAACLAKRIELIQKTGSPCYVSMKISILTFGTRE